MIPDYISKIAITKRHENPDDIEKDLKSANHILQTTLLKKNNIDGKY